MAGALELDHGMLREVAGMLGTASGSDALGALRCVQTTDGVDYGDGGVQAAMSQIGCALSAAARVVAEACGLGSTSVGRISSSVIDADQSLGFEAAALRRGGGGM